MPQWLLLLSRSSNAQVHISQQPSQEEENCIFGITCPLPLYTSPRVQRPGMTFPHLCSRRRYTAVYEPAACPRAGSLWCA